MPSKKEKDHMDKVASFGCIICYLLGFEESPTELHHLQEGRVGKRSSHFKVIPLCPKHHRIGKDSYHYSPKNFKEKWGTQEKLLEKVLTYVKKNDDE